MKHRFCIISTARGLLEPVYGFRSLHHFKQKFDPRTEPVYLLFENEVDLPAIGIGIGLTRAFLPDASLRDLLHAGVDTIHPKAH